MNLAVGFAIAATFGVATAANAEESMPSSAARTVVARAATGAAETSSTAMLDEYVGRYQTTDGVAFVILREGNGLTIDLPEGWSGGETSLRAEGDFFVAEPTVLMTFETNEDGSVLGVLVYPTHGRAAIEAAKVPMPRAVVTIHDVVDAPAQPVRRGIVTIHDVVEAQPAGLTIALVN